MRVGYTKDTNHVLELSETCDFVKVAPIIGDSKQEFKTFVEANENNTVVILNIYDVGLQLAQLLPSLESIKKSGQKVEIVDKFLSDHLPDDDMIDILYQLATMELQIIRDRATLGLQRARSNGIKPGRPAISREIVDKIKRMHQSEKKSIREIAGTLGVSVGTVHKYATKDVVNLN